MAAVEVRRARPDDVAAIAEIYNEAVETTTATFDTEPRTEEDRRAWLASHGPRHAVLVAEHDGRVVGWAALSSFSDRPAYADTAECHVYVRATDRGRGVGRRLLLGALEAGRPAGIHAVLARIASGNEASLRLHESLGFREVGRLREVGLKFGQRLDVHVLEYLYPTSPG